MYFVLSGGGSETVDTMRSMYREYGKGTTRYLRIMRVCFTRSFGKPMDFPPVQLTYRTFMPAKLKDGGFMSIPVYEPQTETCKRAQCWCNATGQLRASRNRIIIIYCQGGNFFVG